MIIILYGNDTTYIDITSKVMLNCLNNNRIIIPSTDIEQVKLFGDPYRKHIKNIIIFFSKLVNNNIESTYKIYPLGSIIDIDISSLNIPRNISCWFDTVNSTPLDILQFIYTKYNINLNVSTQLNQLHYMCVKYISPDDKILLLNNKNYNSVVIQQLLNNTSDVDSVCTNNLITVGDDIESSILSYNKLIQKDNNIIRSDVLLPGYSWVNIITFHEIEIKYNIIFNTIVLDYNSEFYFILHANNSILNNITKLIITNDYGNILHKQYVDIILKDKQFNCVYSHNGGYGPCMSFFYEVWMK